MINKYTMPEISYLETIKHLAKSNNERIFKNKGAENAEIVLSEMFNTAKEEVLIFAGNKKGDVSNSITYNKAVKNFLAEKAGTIKVFLENDIKKKNKEENFLVYQTLINYSDAKSGRVLVKKAPKNFIEDVKYFFNERYHFLIADRKMYRVETDPETFKAICSFNSPEFGEKLSALFLKSFD